MPARSSAVAVETTSTLSVPQLLILALGSFTLAVHHYFLTGLLPQISTDLFVTPSKLGQTAGLGAIVVAFAAPVITALTEKVPRRVLLGIGMSLSLLGIILQASAHRFSSMLIGTLLISLGSATYLPTAYTSAGLLSELGGRARSLAVVMSGAAFALVAGAPLTVRLGQVHGWRPPLWILAGLAGSALMALRLLPGLPAPPAFRGRRQILGDRRILGVFGLTAILLTPSFTVVTYLAKWLTPGTLVPISMFSLGIGGVAGAAIVPALINRRGPLFAVRVSIVCVAIALATLTISRGTLIGTLAPFFVIAACNATILVAQNHRLLGMVPASSANFAVSLDGSATSIGGAMGAAIGGVVLAKIGVHALLPTAVCIAVLAIVFSLLARTRDGQLAIE